MKKLAVVSISVLTICSVSPQLWAMATEDFGNAPLYEAEYREWKGIMPLINHQTRVYHRWINGNEHFYYRGDTAALNDALKKFSAIEIPVREVVLLPGPAETTSLQKDKRVPYHWNLHILSGIARHFALEEKGPNVWDEYPTLRVFVGGKIDLKKLHIPEGVTVIELADLRQRYMIGLESDDREVCAYAAYFLAQVDSHNKESVAAIEKLLDDEGKWVRDMAARALARLRKKRESAKEEEERRAMLADISEFRKSPGKESPE